MPCTEFQKDAVLRNTPFRPHTAATLQRLGNAEFLGEQTRVVGSNRQLKKNRNKIKRDRPHVGETLEALVQPMIAASSFRPARLSN